MANELLTGMLSQPKGPAAPGTTQNSYGGVVPSAPQPPQTPGFQNQTNNAQWWKGAQAAPRSQVPKSPYGKPASPGLPAPGRAIGAPAPMGATSGYPKPPPKTPGTPPPSTPAPPGYVAPPTETGKLDVPAWDQTQDFGGTGKTALQIQQDISRLLASIYAKDNLVNRYNTKSGSAKDIAYSNKNRAIHQKGLDEMQAKLQKMLQKYRSLDFGAAGEGFDPMAYIQQGYSQPQENWYGEMSDDPSSNRSTWMNDFLSQMWG